MVNHSLHREMRAVAWKLALLSIMILMIFSFQNCTQDFNGGALDANSKLANKMEFSYDATIDQIAYMSCPGLKDNPDTDSYFSIRAGAYRVGGLKLKDTFFDTYKKKTPERMADLVSNSPANSNTVLQMAVRTVGALNSVVKGNSTPKQGEDYANMLIGLGSTEMSTHLVSKGIDTATGDITGYRTRHVRIDKSGQGARFEGNLRFGSSEGLASSLRDSFLNSGKAILALTYAQASGSSSSSGDGGSSGAMTDARTPGDVLPGQTKDSSHAYGVGFRLAFVQPTGAKGWMDRDINGNLKTPLKELTPYPTNLLAQVTETNLLDPGDRTSVGNWICPANLRFRIVRNGGDLADASCTRKPDPDPKNLAKDEALRVSLARNSLRYEDWYIDFDSRGPSDGGCIIPKKDTATCYGDLNYVRYNYTSNEGCDPNSAKDTNTLKSQVCLAWVSICYRDN